MVRYGTWVVRHVTEKEHDFQITDENIALLHLERKKNNLSELTPQAAQAPPVRWLSCEIRFKVIFSDLLYMAVTYLTIFRSCAVFWLPPQARRIQTKSENTYMLFAGWEVGMVKNWDRSLENTARGRRPRAAFSRPRSQFFTIRTDP